MEVQVFKQLTTLQSLILNLERKKKMQNISKFFCFCLFLKFYFFFVCFVSGDHSYKLQTELSAHEQQITAMPDVKQTQLTE